MTTSILLDCDPGHDDAIAILLAIGSPDIDLVGVTTTFGNCSIEDATRNALQILELGGRPDIPVAVGAAGPLVGATALGNYVHGRSGLDGPTLPSPSATPDRRDALEFLAEHVRQQPGVTIMATGPSHTTMIPLSKCRLAEPHALPLAVGVRGDSAPAVDGEPACSTPVA